MNSKIIVECSRLGLAVALALLLGACQATNPTTPETQAEVKAAVAEPVEPWEGDGMEIPLDGSSLEAFEKSLARVEVYASPANYTTLVNALDYLLLYDLSAQRDRARLAANLDGLTGYEVVRKVRWQK